jgi:hypothetical protein
MKQPENRSKSDGRPPARSFADEFPVTAENPPVSRLVTKNRPGRLKIRYARLGKPEAG